MDATAELQHMIRKARHDAWGIWASAEGNARNILKLKNLSHLQPVDWRIAAATALGQMCKASAHFAQLDLSETKYTDVLLLSMSMGTSNGGGMVCKYRGGPRFIGARFEPEITKFAEAAGLVVDKDYLWFVEIYKDGPSRELSATEAQGRI